MKLNVVSVYKGFRAEECCYDEYMWMYKYVTETLGQKSIIVDADDLQADPGKQVHSTTSGDCQRFVQRVYLTFTHCNF